VEGAIRKARLIVKLRAHASALDYVPLMIRPDSDFVLSVAASVADVVSGTSNINSAVERVSRIVYSLKELAGSERTSAMFETHLHQGIEKAIASFGTQIQDVDIVRNYQDMGPLRCDPDALQQVWTHLLMNGLQASSYRGMLMIGLRALDNHAEIRIADFGCGIAPEIKDRIFEPFFTTRTSGEGGGMGLAIVKKIVEQHRGRIEVKTEVGVGTTFTVFLPYT
jgi:signal transduction histidine kinase